MNEKKMVLLNEKLNSFLSTIGASIGGMYANVMDRDVNDLYEIINLILELKYEPACDGEYPLEINISDLTKFEHAYFLDIPRWFGKDFDENFNYDEILRRYVTNVSIASDRLKVFAEIMSHRKEMEKHSKGQSHE